MYKIECAINNKVYIGITTQGLSKRWSQHISCSAHEDTKLYRSIRKYGIDHFAITHIASSWSFESLLLAEIQVISEYNSKAKGLNSTHGGDGVMGMEHKPNAKLMMSAQRLELWKSQEYRRKISASQKLAWLRKDMKELQKRSELAKITFSIHKPAVRTKAEKKILWKGKGYNMKLKTHCPSGHEYSSENTSINKKGSRVCMSCKRLTRNISRNNKRTEKRLIKTREDHKLENRRAEGGKAY